MKSIRQLACLAVMAAIGFLSTSAPAHAGEVLSLSDGTTTVTVPGDAFGVASFSGPLGIFNINVTTGISKPSLGGPGDGVMDLNTVNISSLGGSPTTLTIKLTDTDFTPFGPGTLTNNVGGTISGGTATAQAWKDPLNREFGMGAGTFTPGLQSLLTSPFASTASVGDTVTAPYSMTIQLVLQTTGGAFDFSADDRLSNVAVPELDPGSTASGLTLVSGSLLMLFGRRRRACA